MSKRDAQLRDGSTATTNLTKRLRALVAYDAWSNFKPAMEKYLLALKMYTSFDVSYVHVTHDAKLNFDLNSFDVVFQNYCAQFVMDGLISESYRVALKTFRGLRVIAVQDEYDRINVLHEALQEFNFHLLLTCVQPEFWPRIYPPHKLPHLRLVHVLTGYVPDDLMEKYRTVTPLAERPIMIGYRGGYLGARYGRLTMEKREIGERMRKICEARGLSCDIKTEAKNRIDGSAWFEFIGNCRAGLGSESGSNVFDFDGSIQKTWDELSRMRQHEISHEEFKPYIEHVESEFNMGQISPRIFEYAVMRTPMILFRGRYSDALQPDVHYIPLEKDFSNVNQVLDKLNDLASLEAMADRAYSDLVRSGRFGYRAFAWKLEAEITNVYNAEISNRDQSIKEER